MAGTARQVSLGLRVHAMLSLSAWVWLGTGLLGSSWVSAGLLKISWISFFFRSSYTCRFFVLPCCFFDFVGRYQRRQSRKTQYREYLDFVLEVGLSCGFHVQEDCLRIPSTKRVCARQVQGQGVLCALPGAPLEVLQSPSSGWWLSLQMVSMSTSLAPPSMLRFILGWKRLVFHSCSSTACH